MGLGYDALYAAGALLSSPVWAYRMSRTGKWRTDWPARFGRGSELAADPRSTVLIHGVSVGEVASVAPIVRLLESEASERVRVVVSATTDTGITRACSLYGERHPVVRYPFDLTLAVARFLDRVRPDVVGLTELEVWPNFVEACERRGIPVVVISGRLSAPSHARYARVRSWVRPHFARLHAVGAQNPVYAERFADLGVPPGRLHVTDSTKWDAAPQRAAEHEAEALAEALGIDRTRPLVVAGSTGPGEEALLLDRVPGDVQLLIAPRKPERFREVEALADFVVRSRGAGEPARSAAGRFLLDTLGELETAYALADVVVVGRSFVPLGGSDPIAPVALGRATLIGPHHANFRDVVEALAADDVLRVVSEPGGAIRDLLADHAFRARMREAGPAAVAARRGAARRSADLLLGALDET